MPFIINDKNFWGESSIFLMFLLFNFPEYTEPQIETEWGEWMKVCFFKNEIDQITIFFFLKMWSGNRVLPSLKSTQYLIWNTFCNNCWPISSSILFFISFATASCVRFGLLAMLLYWFWTSTNCKNKERKRKMENDKNSEMNLF